MDRECRVCGLAVPQPVVTLPNYPMVAGPVVKTPKTVPTCDLEVGLCHHCGICVLLNTDADNLAYDDEYTSSCIGYGSIGSVDKQTDRFVDFIGKADKPLKSEVLEIGCYDGTLMSLLKKRYWFNMLGCEPCAPATEEATRAGHIVHVGVFEASRYSRLDMVVARNILEHISSPSQFVRGVALVLKQDGAFVLEVPAGEHYICDGILGTIVPQHSCYFGKGSLERLLVDHFATVVVEEDKATIRARASHPRHVESGHGTKDNITSVAWLRIGEQIRQTRYDAVRRAVDGEKVDIFGANTCALELIATGTIKTEQIDRVYDDDRHKWDRYLVNTDRIVSPRTAVRGMRKVLVCSYTHRQSIANYITGQDSIAIKLYGDNE